ncbi:MAG TPA: hypothetical protein PK777_08885, partial [Thermoguttaceae bacterium]|nr:hypothetical protein [Thermoguttaceae bacterium]
MQESFDPYAVFLGFPPANPPKNYYELLGLPLFESDPEKIARAVDALRGRVRHIRPGAYLAQWQQLLDELTAAKLCLLDPVAKATYDAYLSQGGVHVPGGNQTGSQQSPPLAPMAVPPADFSSPAVYPSANDSQAPFNYPNYPSYPNYPNTPSQPAFTPADSTWTGHPGSQGVDFPTQGGYPLPGSIPSVQPIPVPPGTGGTYPLPYGGQAGVETVSPSLPGWGVQPESGLPGGWATGQAGQG